MGQPIHILMGRIHIRMRQLIHAGRFMGQRTTRRLSRLDLDIRPMAITMAEVTMAEVIMVATITVVLMDIIMPVVFMAVAVIMVTTN